MSKRRKGLYGFNSFSGRGAWVEMMFMAAASFRGYRVLTPWEEGLPYDVAIEEKGQVLRIQVKSTSHKAGAGYLCDFLHSSGGRIQRYDADELDVCVGYVVPEEVWYIIPAHRVTGCTGKSSNYAVPVRRRAQPPEIRGLSRGLGAAGKGQERVGERIGRRRQNGTAINSRNIIIPISGRDAQADRLPESRVQRPHLRPKIA